MTQQFLQEHAVYEMIVPRGPQKNPKSLLLFQPVRPVEQFTVSGSPQGRPMGDNTMSSDAMATPAIAAAEMTIVVSEVNFMIEYLWCLGEYICFYTQ